MTEAALRTGARVLGAFVSRAQLHRWRDLGLMPSPRMRGRGRGRGREALYPRTAIAQAAALALAVKAVRNLDEAAWAVWALGFPVTEYVQDLLVEELEDAAGRALRIIERHRAKVRRALASQRAQAQLGRLAEIRPDHHVVVVEMLNRVAAGVYHRRARSDVERQVATNVVDLFQEAIVQGWNDAARTRYRIPSVAPEPTAEEADTMLCEASRNAVIRHQVRTRIDRAQPEQLERHRNEAQLLYQKLTRYFGLTGTTPEPMPRSFFIQYLADRWFGARSDTEWARVFEMLGFQGVVPSPVQRPDRGCSASRRQEREKAAMSVRATFEQERVPFTNAGGVLVLRGYSLRIAVERGHLVIEDQTLGVRRQTRLSRVDREIRRLIVIGSSGSMTFDAVKWLDGVGLPLVHLHPDGRVLMVAAPSAAHRPPVRRAQALAGTNEIGLQVSRRLLMVKVAGQLDVLGRLDAVRDIRQEVAGALRGIERAADVDEIRRAEAQAAQSYWTAWRDVPIRIVDADRRRCPRHWSAFGGRHSPLGGRGANRAVNPANAILNYCYSVLESEARIACLAVGLDPMLGVLHTDRTARGALALDLMEPIRPTVDRFVLDLLAQREFGRRDLHEMPDGQCRLMPSVTEPLAAAAGRWARLVMPVAQSMVAALLEAAEKGPRPRHHGETPYRRRRRLQVRTIREFDDRPDPSVDPRYRGAAIRRRQRTMDGVHRANAAWKEQSKPAMSREAYLKVVVPRLETIPLKQLMTATGLTNASCSQLRRGITVPHPRHWGPLAALVRGR